MENTPPPQADVRERSNSDPDTSASVSLLARISQRSQEPSGISTPVDSNNNSFQFTRPPTGSLRVDTTVLDGASMKQNKSAYPSFASNGILLPAPEHITAKSPAPVTAGPDLGRHNLARMEIVGYPAVCCFSWSIAIYFCIHCLLFFFLIEEGYFYVFQWW